MSRIRVAGWRRSAGDNAAVQKDFPKIDSIVHATLLEPTVEIPDSKTVPESPIRYDTGSSLGQAAST